MGGKAEDTVFTTDIVAKYFGIADVTFEVENTNLIKLAQAQGKDYTTGRDMFANQGKVVLETILDEKIDIKVLRRYVESGLNQVV